MLIFGWGKGKAKDRGEVAPLSCPNCHNTVFLHDVESKQQFSLYFVPVVKYGGDRYLLCPVCGRGIQVLPGQRAAVDQMRATTAQFRRRGVTEAAYRSVVGRFWQQLGVPTGPALPAPAAATPAGLSGLAPGASPAALLPGAAPAALAPGTAAAVPIAPPIAPNQPQVPADVVGPELAGHLDALARLHAAGSLTDEEFAEAKRRLLNI